MPDIPWPFFRDNATLAKALSALAAEVLKEWVSAKYGLRAGRHCHSPHFQREVGVQLARTHHGDWGRTAQVLRHMGCSVYYDRDARMDSWRRGRDSTSPDSPPRGTIRRSLCEAASQSRSAALPGSGTEPSGFGTKTKSYVARLRRNAYWRSSLIIGPSTSRNAISTPFGALGSLLRAREGKLQQPSL